MRVAFILLAHEKPDMLRPMLESLLRAGADVYVHYDLSSPYDIHKESESWGLDLLPGRAFFAERVKVVWGEWSIVKATLNCLYLARSNGYENDYFMLLSGACLPTKPLALLNHHLESQDVDYIESVDAVNQRWVVDGIQEERWNYYHYVNWRYNPFLFRVSNKIQSLLGVHRTIPCGHQPRMGSQWWCLRAATVDKVLSLIDDNPGIEGFYRRTWIPDELFFQTLVGNLIPAEEISGELLTRYQFNSAGVPRIYFDDDLDELLWDKAFFARKVSPSAKALRSHMFDKIEMNTEQFSEFLEERRLYAQELFSNKIELHELEKAVQPYGLATSEVQVADYLKGLPETLLVFCSASRFAHQQVAEACEGRSGLLYIGGVFGEAATFIGKAEKEFLSSLAESISAVNHRWYAFLGEALAGKIEEVAVLCLGLDADVYLDELRWKKNCHIVLLKSDWNCECAGMEVPELIEASYRSKTEARLFQKLRVLLSEGDAHFYEVGIERQDGIRNILSKVVGGLNVS